jgi:hypothetical protein
MVEVTLLVEGGLHPNSNDSAETFENSAKLRESLYKLLNNGLEVKENISLKIEMRGSYKAVIDFKKQPLSHHILALIDFDVFQRGDESFDAIQGYREFIFFMVQAMESWILSQPDAIERAFEPYKVDRQPIEENRHIKSVAPELISSPDKVLDTLLKEHFRQEKKGRVLPIKYKKLGNSHVLLEQLDIHRLKEQFIDVKNLLNKINELTIYA